ncbi:MFS transporter [Bdellovibrio svalbardensis]|uniref:MFS transporter n=1 Tax=Bdellovibrio svalbardensis TaxID=2972972 RepID=A0ABT6DKC6_9BACT|nr:MFS transporter [Bdellovibrio svalbardensis]MDG0817313.1 MFS transporter [Bdellovibrio svalbardensis]
MPIFSSDLGKDFWNYRLGQVVSLLGDSCSHIALAWWILDKTGSAVEMSSVLAPAMVVRIFLMPLFGPLADKYSRKAIIIIADLWRFVFTGALAAMVFSNYYDTYVVIALFILNSIGSALFQAAAGGIVPQIVPREKLQIAAQQTQAINSFAGILGGVAGGIVVSTLGVFGAFLIDALSYVLAAWSTNRIQSNTVPVRKEVPQMKAAFHQWTQDFGEGFKLLFKIPVIFWICIVAMFLNLAFAPLGVILPVLAKEGRNMPPWFLGALESSISLGAIVGAVTIGYVNKRIRADLLTVMAIAMMCVGTMVLPWVPNVALPLTVLFWIGIGGTWANIPMNTQIALAIPDAYRARVGSIMGFLCQGISPLGLAAAGVIISSFGLTNALVAMGGIGLLLTPLMLLIPNFAKFMSAPPEKADQFLLEYYPEAFGSSGDLSSQGTQPLQE